MATLPLEEDACATLPLPANCACVAAAPATTDHDDAGDNDSSASFSYFTPLVLCAGGGGSSRTGVANKICALPLDFGADTPVTTVADFATTDEAPWSLAASPCGTVVVAGVVHSQSASKSAAHDVSCAVYERGSKESPAYRCVAAFDTLGLMKGKSTKAADDYVCATSVSPDLRHIATGSESGILHVANYAKRVTAASWAPLRLECRIYSVAFAPDSKAIYVVTPRSARLYDCETGGLAAKCDAAALAAFRCGQVDYSARKFACAVNFGRTAAEIWTFDATGASNLQESPSAMRPELRCKAVAAPQRAIVSITAAFGIVAVGMADLSVGVYRGSECIACLADAHEAPVSALVLAQIHSPRRHDEDEDEDGIRHIYLYSASFDRTLRRTRLLGLMGRYQQRQQQQRKRRRRRQLGLCVAVLLLAVVLPLLIAVFLSPTTTTTKTRTTTTTTDSTFSRGREHARARDRGGDDGDVGARRI